jgi:hypothetical protein
LSEDPTTGTIAAGANTDIEVTFDPAGTTQPGDYHAKLKVKNNTPYALADIPVTLHVTMPETWGKITGVVTGLGLCDVPGAPLKDATVNITLPDGTPVFSLTTAADGSYTYALPGGTYKVEVVMDGFVTKVDTVVVPGGRGTIVHNVDLRKVAPCITADTTSIAKTVLPNGPTSITFKLTNNGAGEGTFSIAEKPAGPLAKTQIQLSLSNQPSQKVVPANGVSPFSLANTKPAPAAAAKAPQSSPQAVDLVLDDGSAEDSIGLTGGGQFVWLNRFTPLAGDFPFQLTQVQALFNTTVAVGDEMQVVIYSDTDGDGDPGTGAVLLYNETFTVQYNDFATWNLFDLTDPVLLEGPGDVLIGFVNRSGGAGYSDYPAAIDQNTLAYRSWIGAYSAGDPPAEPPLPSDSLWGVIDDFGLPGTWTIRGVGEPANQDIPWLSEAPLIGTIPAGGFVTITVTFDATGMAVGTYEGDLVISNNPNAKITIPVTMTVNYGFWLPNISKKP